MNPLVPALTALYECEIQLCIVYTYTGAPVIPLAHKTNPVRGSHTATRFPWEPDTERYLVVPTRARAQLWLVGGGGARVVIIIPTVSAAARVA
jgi:hypothetical protein